MDYKGFLETERKLHQLLTTISPENAQRAGYILGDKFIVGLRKLIKQIDRSTREFLYVFVDTEDIKTDIGSVIGIRINKGLQNTGKSSFTIYYKASKGINGVVYLCDDKEDKEVELKRIRKVSYKRRPNGWGDLESKRLALRENYEDKGEATLTILDIERIGRIIGKLTEGMFNHDEYREYQFTYTTNIKREGRTSAGRDNRVGFRVRMFNKDNYKVLGHYNSVITYEHQNQREVLQYIESKLYEYLQGNEKVVRNVMDSKNKKLYLDRE